MSDMVERPVPYDLGAEEAVLGSLLLDRDAVIKIAAFLRPEDFYREAHGWVYGAVLDLYARREPPPKMSPPSSRCSTNITTASSRSSTAPAAWWASRPASTTLMR